MTATATQTQAQPILRAKYITNTLQAKQVNNITRATQQPELRVITQYEPQHQKPNYYDILAVIRQYNSIDRKQLVNNLRIIRIKYNLTNDNLIKMFGYKQSKINSWFCISGRNRPTLEDILRIITKYKIDITEVF